MSPLFVGNWDGKNCGGRGWFKGRRSWSGDSDDCYEACDSCISSAIDLGATDAECSQTSGFEACWMGYH